INSFVDSTDPLAGNAQIDLAYEDPRLTFGKDLDIDYSYDWQSWAIYENFREWMETGAGNLSGEFEQLFQRKPCQALTSNCGCTGYDVHITPEQELQEMRINRQDVEGVIEQAVERLQDQFEDWRNIECSYTIQTGGLELKNQLNASWIGVDPGPESPHEKTWLLNRLDSDDTQYYTYSLINTIDDFDGGSCRPADYRSNDARYEGAISFDSFYIPENLDEDLEWTEIGLETVKTTFDNFCQSFEGDVVMEQLSMDRQIHVEFSVQCVDTEQFVTTENGLEPVGGSISLIYAMAEICENPDYHNHRADGRIEMPTCVDGAEAEPLECLLECPACQECVFRDDVDFEVLPREDEDGVWRVYRVNEDGSTTLLNPEDAYTCSNQEEVDMCLRYEFDPVSGEQVLVSDPLDYSCGTCVEGSDGLNACQPVEKAENRCKDYMAVEGKSCLVCDGIHMAAHEACIPGDNGVALELGLMCSGTFTDGDEFVSGPGFCGFCNFDGTCSDESEISVQEAFEIINERRVNEGVVKLSEETIFSNVCDQCQTCELQNVSIPGIVTCVADPEQNYREIVNDNEGNSVQCRMCYNGTIAMSFPNATRYGCSLCDVCTNEGVCGYVPGYSENVSNVRACGACEVCGPSSDGIGTACLPNYEVNNNTCDGQGLCRWCQDGQCVVREENIGEICASSGQEGDGVTVCERVCSDDGQCKDGSATRGETCIPRQQLINSGNTCFVEHYTVCTAQGTCTFGIPDGARCCSSEVYALAGQQCCKRPDGTFYASADCAVQDTS
ncbi:MAG: hypothetical protein ACMXYF_02355, partial [Candidatus Woesearchaeota archaeon]